MAGLLGKGHVEWEGRARLGLDVLCYTCGPAREARMKHRIHEGVPSGRKFLLAEQ
jgi:hypothetical protein